MSLDYVCSLTCYACGCVMLLRGVFLCDGVLILTDPCVSGCVPGPLQDFDNGQYCYNTLKTILAFRDAPANTTNLVLSLCSNCGRQIFNYLFNVSVGGCRE